MKIIVTFIITIVLIISLYFFHKHYTDVSSKKQVKEEFSALNVDANYRNTIKETFKKVLGRDAHEFEVKIYASLMKHPYDSKTITKKIQGSTEYMRLINKDKESIASNTKESSVTAPAKAAAPSTAPATTTGTATTTAPATATATTTGTSPKLETFKEEIEKSDETVNSFIKKMTFEDKLGAYKVIVKIFEKNLERIPTTEELNYFTYKLKGDNMSVQKLESVLQSSSEFRILSVAQTNIVNARIIANITDAQLDLMVSKAYEDVMEKELSDEDVKTFLRKKLHDYALNETKLKKLIKVINNIEDYDNVANINSKQIDNTSVDAIDMDNGTGSGNAGGNAGGNDDDNDIDNDIDNNGDDDGGNAGGNDDDNDDSVSNKQNNAKNKKQPLKPTREVRTKGPDDIPDEKQFCFYSPLLEDKCMAKNAYKNNGAFFDSLYAANNNFQSSRENCTYDYISMEKDQKLANEQMKRHKELYGKRCNSSTEKLLSDQLDGYGRPFDTNAKLGMRNIKYGALLEDVENTKVGSILPRFVFKELAR